MGGGGGGAQKIMTLCPHDHYERETELTFGRGPCRARLRALEALGLFYCSLVLSEPYL